MSYSSSSITDQLKNQLQNSEALIILITADSLNSAWIPFEAGSFWTTDKPVIPILGTGLAQNDLPGPLKSFLSIAITTPDFADKLNSAINQLANKLQIEQRFTTRRKHTLREFAQHLEDWKSKYSESNASQQLQIEELNRQIEEVKVASQQEKEQIKQSYEAQIQELQKSNQVQQQLGESLKSQIQQLKQQVKQLKPSTIVHKIISEVDTIERRGTNGVDYNKLCDLLKQQQWREADQETDQIMLQVTIRESERYLRAVDIDRFPCTDLCVINQLWSQCSYGKFGLSTQGNLRESWWNKQL